MGGNSIFFNNRESRKTVMARKTGSDELYRLIHSLTVEEKGYFKKFAARHKAAGNVYIRLFDAINKQKNFEEESLIKTFAAYNYPDLKLYLKDTITDCMVLYYKTSHPHVKLFNQLQKIHFLMVKGLTQEAIKAVEKALKQSAQMELFSITQYLLRMQIDLKMAASSSVDEINEASGNYRTLSTEAAAAEDNLRATEFLNLSWFIAANNFGKNSVPPDLEKERNKINSLTAKSIRAELKKLNTLNYIFNMEDNRGARYETTRSVAFLSRNFHSQHDSSFNIVRPLCNHIVSCMDFKKIDEMQQLCNQMMTEEANIKLYYNLAFPMIGLSSVVSCFYAGQFKKGLAEVYRTEAQTMDAVSSKNDFVAVSFQKTKVALLFMNQKFGECWLVLQNLYNELKKSHSALADVWMLEMMIQTEIGNYRSISAMAKKAEKKIAALQLANYNYEVMIDFFKQVSSRNIRKDAASALSKLKNYQRAKNLLPPLVFGLIGYEHWLEAKSSDKPLEEIVKKGT
jgi:hypothetical protein